MYYKKILPALFTIAALGTVSNANWIQHTNFVCNLTAGKYVTTPTRNQNHYLSNVEGTDLGFFVNHAGQIYSFYGDTYGFSGTPADTYRGPGTKMMDAVGYNNAPLASQTANPATFCNNLRFINNAGVSIGNASNYLVQQDWAPIRMTSFPGGTGIGDYFLHSPAENPNAGGSLEVPTGAFSYGGNIYVFYSGHTDIITGKIDRMRKSFLAKWTSPTTSTLPDMQVLWEMDNYYTYGSGVKFINVAPVVSGSYVYLFGTGDLRRSTGTYLARIPTATLEAGTGIEYYNPTNSTWSTSRSNAVMITDDPYAAEIDVKYYPEIGKWIMIYAKDPLPNDGEDRPAHLATSNEIFLRYANAPEGPWSDKIIVTNRKETKYRRHCTNIFSCANGTFYAPTLYPVVTSVKDVGGKKRFDLWFQVSTWDPYKTIFMRSRITLPN